MRYWVDFLPEEQCVLYGGAIGDLLHDLLGTWMPGASWDARLKEVSRLAAAVIRLAQDGLIEVCFREHAEAEAWYLTLDEVPEVVLNPGNWWTDDGPRHVVEISTTRAADDIGIQPPPFGASRS